MQKHIIGGSFEVTYATFRDGIALEMFRRPYALLSKEAKKAVDQEINRRSPK
jgi:hypothetical protein